MPTLTKAGYGESRTVAWFVRMLLRLSIQIRRFLADAGYDGYRTRLLIIRKLKSARAMVGADLAYGFLTTLIAGLIQFDLGNVLLMPLLYLLVGPLPGTYAGVKLNERVLKEMEHVLDGGEFDSLKKELGAIADMKSDAFDPVLTRLSEFAVDPYLRRLFGGTRRSSVDFAELLKPGRQTIFRIPSHEVGLHIGPLIQSVILLKLWFAVLWRTTHTREEDRTPVVLAIDEFQDLQRLQAIQTILSQARSQGLCLLLSHQTTAQLDDTLLKIVIGKCGVQGAGRVSGDDASRLARAWDPQYKKEIEQALVTQPDFTWTCRLRAGPGEEQSPPVQERLLKPPGEKHGEEEVRAFCAKMKELYGADRTEGSVFDERSEVKPAWTRFLLPGQPAPTKEVWWLLITEEAPPRLRTPSR